MTGRWGWKEVTIPEWKPVSPVPPKTDVSGVPTNTGLETSHAYIRKVLARREREERLCNNLSCLNWLKMKWTIFRHKNQVRGQSKWVLQDQLIIKINAEVSTTLLCTVPCLWVFWNAVRISQCCCLGWVRLLKYSQEGYYLGFPLRC